MLQSLASDYPDPELLACLEQNVQRNLSPRQANLSSEHAAPRARVQPLLWGDRDQMNRALAFVHNTASDNWVSQPPPSASLCEATKTFPNTLFNANPALPTPAPTDAPHNTTQNRNHGGYDLILCSDVLWMTSAHAALLDTLCHLLHPEGRVLIISGLHTGRRPLSEFLNVAAERGLVPDWQAPGAGVWERYCPPSWGGRAQGVPWRGHPDLARYDPPADTRRADDAGASLGGQAPGSKSGDVSDAAALEGDGSVDSDARRKFQVPSAQEGPGYEPEYDERAHWSVCALLRHAPS